MYFNPGSLWNKFSAFLVIMASGQEVFRQLLLQGESSGGLGGGAGGDKLTKKERDLKYRKEKPKKDGEAAAPRAAPAPSDVLTSKEKREEFIKRRIAHKESLRQRQQEDHEDLGKEGEQYVDRAAERRKQAALFESEWETFQNRGVDESLVLGGSENSTHLVKGLDRGLLEQIKAKLDAAPVDQQQGTLPSAPAIAPVSAEALAFEKVMFHELHPDQVGFAERVEKMTSELCRVPLGAVVKGSSRQFLPGKESLVYLLDMNSRTSGLSTVLTR